MPYQDHPLIIRAVERGGDVWVEEAFGREYGVTVAAQGTIGLLDSIHPEDVPAFASVLEVGVGRCDARLRTEAGDVALHWEVRTHDGVTVALGVRPEGARPPCGEVTLADHVEVDDAALKETLREMALIVEGHHPGRRCSILLLDRERMCVSVGAGPSLPSDYNAAVEGLSIGPFVGSCGTAAFWSRPMMVADIQNNWLWRDLREYAATAGVAACWSQPITARSGEVLGALALYNTEVSRPMEHEVSGLGMAANMVALAIEQRRAEAALRRNQAVLDEHVREAAKMEAVGVLAGGVAHDFNNMLAAVQGNAELALELLGEETAARPMLEEIVAASRKSNELCNQMLAYAGRGMRTMCRLECNELIREMGELQRARLSKKAELVYDLTSDATFVDADRAQMNQVIMNLIANGADAVGENEGEIRVATSVVVEALGDSVTQFVRIEVQDNGSGMTEETRSRIYDPFFTTKDTGRGLGLAAVRGIVKSHQGRIQLESAVGKGTKFTITLPRAEAPERETSARVEAPAGGRRRRVLLADDEPAVRRVHAHLLRHAGYEVVVAADGREAVEVFARDAVGFDGLVLDLSMPHLDGEEALREIRRRDARVPAVLMSGFTEQEMIGRCRDAGFAAVVQKPARRAVLLSTLEAVIAGTNGAAGAAAMGQ